MSNMGCSRNCPVCQEEDAAFDGVLYNTPAASVVSIPGVGVELLPDYMERVEKELFVSPANVKPPMSHLGHVYTALAGAVRVMEHGKEKHGAVENFHNVSYQGHLDASMRHLLAACGGEYVDPESGELHISHAITRLMFAVELYLNWSQREEAECPDLPA